ncbi:MAG: ShlB/FhaC/HecB family hemolysin secretion/activation protein [Phycisphaeraceae bacterium]|nr:ShlB/FhaC/HecB family hemolysin secretion/activation protein [Phycisphaeraceae bacterium]
MPSPAPTHVRRLLLTLATASLALTGIDAGSLGAAPAPSQRADAVIDDGPTYQVGTITVRYLRENARHPALDEVMAVPVGLSRLSTGWAAPRDGLEVDTRLLSEWSALPPASYHASALQRMIESLRDFFVDRDLLGVYVIPDPADLTQTGVDLRGGRSNLGLLVTTGIVTEMRTVASGERVAERGGIDPAEATNHPLHARILRDSPAQPAADGQDDAADLLHKSELDRYVFWLGRHPGRRVDLAVSAAQEVGGTALDYMVIENRPLVIYGQVSNTGTQSTDYWRERVGFFHTQLTNNDDILSVDFTTAHFDRFNALTASYEAPFSNRRVRWKVEAGWSEYTASDVGAFNDTFKGTSWNIGAEVAWNFYQRRELFVDLVGGVRFDRLNVENPTFFIEGTEELITPWIGLRMDQTSEWYANRAAVILEWQGDFTSIDPAELTALGRSLPDTDWTVLKWDFNTSVYLEPLLNRAAWEDPSTPESSTLAHEVQLSLRGQWAMGNRLIPQAQSVVGGLYTVRGYPQSVTAGDTAVVASAEYRFHYPRSFLPQPEPRDLFGYPFRAAPQFVYGTPDWDLIFKGFVDIGRTGISDRLFFEESDTLVGAGVGVEFLYRRNLNVRMDWGFALREMANRGVASGANRLHFVATVLF